MEPRLTVVIYPGSPSPRPIRYAKSKAQTFSPTKKANCRSRAPTQPNVAILLRGGGQHSLCKQISRDPLTKLVTTYLCFASTGQWSSWTTRYKTSRSHTSRSSKSSSSSTAVRTTRPSPSSSSARTSVPISFLLSATAKSSSVTPTVIVSSSFSTGNSRHSSTSSLIAAWPQTRTIGENSTGTCMNIYYFYFHDDML